MRSRRSSIVVCSAILRPGHTPRPPSSCRAQSPRRTRTRGGRAGAAADERRPAGGERGGDSDALRAWSRGWCGDAAGSAPPAPHEPVSVLIADFENRVNDPVFDGSIEQAPHHRRRGRAVHHDLPAELRHRRLAAQLITDGKTSTTRRAIDLGAGWREARTGRVDRRGAGGYQIVARLIDPAVGKTLKTATARAGTRPKCSRRSARWPPTSGATSATRRRKARGSPPRRPSPRPRSKRCVNTTSRRI